MATTVRNRDSAIVRRARLRRLSSRVGLLLGAVTLAFVVAACGEDEPEPTMAERLASVEGRELTAAEFADRLAVGDALCRMSDDVLDGVWRQLNERQLNFQDVVFGEICPDRSIFYASRTGRYVTEEATESGVSPNTTRPPITTAQAETTPAPAETTSSSAATSSTDSSATATSATIEDPEDNETSVVEETSTTVASSSTSTSTGTASSTTATTTSTSVSTTTVEGEGG